MHKKAYTLIELLMTLTLIAVLAALLLPIYGKVIKKYKRQVTTIYNWKNKSIEAGIQYDVNDELVNYTTNVPVPGMWKYGQ